MRVVRDLVHLGVIVRDIAECDLTPSCTLYVVVGDSHLTDTSYTHYRVYHDHNATTLTVT